jgi:hypothetical protein
VKKRGLNTPKLPAAWTQALHYKAASEIAPKMYNIYDEMTEIATYNEGVTSKHWHRHHGRRSALT